MFCCHFFSVFIFSMPSKVIIIVIKFMSLGINMFWALLRLILESGPKHIYAREHKLYCYNTHCWQKCCPQIHSAQLLGECFFPDTGCPMRTGIPQPSKVSIVKSTFSQRLLAACAINSWRQLLPKSSFWASNRFFRDSSSSRSIAK